MTSFASLYRKGAVLALLAGALAFGGCAGSSKVRSGETASKPQERPIEPVPTRVLDHVISASLYESQGDYMRALHEYYKALAYDSSESEVYVAIAEMHRNLDEPDHARMILERGIASVGPRLELLLPLGRLQYQNYMFEDAQKTFELYTRQDSTNAEVLAALAALYERNEEPLKATRLYERLMNLEPESRELILSRMGSLLTRAGEPEKALEIYTRLLDLRPDMHMVPFMIGSLKLDLGDTLAARDSFLQAASIAPYEGRYWDLGIRLSVILGDSSTATATIDSALTYNPDSVPLLELASSAMITYDRDEQAVQYLQQLIEVDSANVSHWVNLGFVYHELHRWDDAERTYEKALKASPDDPQLLNNFAYLLAVADRRLDEALGFVDKALERVPDNASYVDTRGWILYKLGKIDEAKAELERARDMDPDNPEILDHLGDVYRDLGDMTRARQLWTDAIDKGGDSSLIEEKLNP